MGIRAGNFKMNENAEKPEDMARHGLVGDEVTAGLPGFGILGNI